MIEVTTVGCARIAQIYTDLLADPRWTPSRAHIEALRNQVAGAGQAMDELAKHIDGAVRVAAEANADVLKLQSFKDYVHERLDDAGIPTHPDGEHSKAGCRVGDRLDIALEQWPEWAEKLLRLLESWGAEYEADDEINLPDELSEWLHHYASDIKQTAERKRLQKAGEP